MTPWKIRKNYVFIHLTPLLRNYRFFGVSYMANIVPRNATGHGRGGGEYPIKLRRNKTVQSDTFNPLPLLIADEIGRVPDSVMGHDKGGVLKYLR